MKYFAGYLLALILGLNLMPLLASAETLFECDDGSVIDTEMQSCPDGSDGSESTSTSSSTSSTTDTTKTSTSSAATASGKMDILCPGGEDITGYIPGEIPTSTEVEFWKNATEDSSPEPAACGEKNSSGYIEKGDCNLGDEVSYVTEVTELIAPDTKIGDGTNKIVTLYAGDCCYLGTLNESSTGYKYNCYDPRTYYFETYNECDSQAQNCQKRQWIIGTSGLNVIKLMVKQIYTFGALTVGSIAVLTIILQGVKISFSGVSGDISESKKKIVQAISGIVLLFLSALILYTINPTFFS